MSRRSLASGLPGLALALASACGAPPGDGDGAAGERPDEGTQTPQMPMGPQTPADPRPGPRRPDGVAPCYDPAATPLPEVAQFFAALSAEDRAARPAATKALQMAAQAHPQDEEPTLQLGLSYLWRLADPSDAEQQDMTGLVLAAFGAKAQLEKAYKLCPTDHRVPAWLGPVLVNMGVGLRNQQMIDDGLAVLQRGIDHYPAFVLFSRLLIYADRPRTDPDFQKALQAVQQNIGACGDLATSLDPACTNSARVPHNVEGGSVFLGDVLAKAGQRDEALKIYKDAQAGKGHASWPFQQLLRDRIATLDARVQAYADADPANDPDAAWNARYQCAICHQK